MDNINDKKKKSITSMANLFFSTTNKEIDFDLLDLLRILVSVFKTDDLKIQLFDYEYNGVKSDWRNINQSIINFLEKEDKSNGLAIGYMDFLKFAKFIQYTENGSFHIFLPSKNINLKINVFDSYFWNISSNDKETLDDLLNHNILAGFNVKIEA